MRLKRVFFAAQCAPKAGHVGPLCGVSWAAHSRLGKNWPKKIFLISLFSITILASQTWFSIKVSYIFLCPSEVPRSPLHVQIRHSWNSVLGVVPLYHPFWATKFCFRLTKFTYFHPHCSLHCFLIYTHYCFPLLAHFSLSASQLRGGTLGVNRW